MVATRLAAANASRAEIIQSALEMLGNTPQFDLTGHPAMSLPCGMSRDLPVGMMLVRRHYAESMIYRAAAASNPQAIGERCSAQDPVRSLGRRSGRFWRRLGFRILR
jgi:Asp-tRNA(Asn)/Glu-tRNA(Gln) amidotransferase A subunit family amidase